MNARDKVGLVIDILGAAARFGLEAYKTFKVAPEYGTYQADDLVAYVKQRTEDVRRTREQERAKINAARKVSK